MALIRPLLLILVFLALGRPAGGVELSVFAASSLTEAMREVAGNFESSHPGAKALLYFAGSQTLATQIEQGAPADLFISANDQVMKRLQSLGLVETPQPLLGNQLALAVRQGLQPALTSVKDLARPGLLLTIGNRQVPVGQYTRQLFAELAADPSFGPALVKGIEGNVVSEENQVKAVLAKLLLGEADAGIVYRSDLAAGAGRRLTAIPLPEQYRPRVVYPLAKVCGGSAQAALFFDYLFRAQAQRIFARYGLQKVGDR
jgi:molybdate transport system substrate-binding protein